MFAFIYPNLRPSMDSTTNDIILDEVSKHLVMLADWIAVSMEQIFFEAQVVANKELDDIEEELLKIMDLEGGQAEDEISRESILSKEVKVDEPNLGEGEDVLEAEGYPPE